MDEYQKALKARQKADHQVVLQLEKLADASGKYAELMGETADILAGYQHALLPSRHIEQLASYLHFFMHNTAESEEATSSGLKAVAEALDGDQLYKAHLERAKLTERAEIPFIDAANREMVEFATTFEVEILQRWKEASRSIAEGAQLLSNNVTNFSLALLEGTDSVDEESGVGDAIEQLNFLSQGDSVRSLMSELESTSQNIISMKSMSPQFVEADFNSISDEYAMNTEKTKVGPELEEAEDLGPMVRLPVTVIKQSNNGAKRHIRRHRRKHPKELKNCNTECVFVPKRKSRIIFETEYVISGPIGNHILENETIPQTCGHEEMESKEQQTSLISGPASVCRPASPETTLSWPSEPYHVGSSMPDEATRPPELPPPRVPSSAELQHKLRELDHIMAQETRTSEEGSQLFNEMSAFHNLLNNTSSYLQSNSGTSNSGPDPLNIFSGKPFEEMPEPEPFSPQDYRVETEQEEAPLVITEETPLAQPAQAEEEEPEIISETNEPQEAPAPTLEENTVTLPKPKGSSKRASRGGVKRKIENIDDLL